MERRFARDQFCVTSPTRVTCKIASDLVPAATRLSEVYSPPFVSVTMAYKKKWRFCDLPGGTEEEPLNGFGHLLPYAMDTWCSTDSALGRKPEINCQNFGSKVGFRCPLESSVESVHCR